MAAHLSEGMEELFPKGLEREFVPRVRQFLHLGRPDEVGTWIPGVVGRS